MQSIDDYIKKMSINGRSIATQTNTRNVLEALNKFKPIQNCEETDIVEYFEQFECAESSKNLHKIIIKKFFKDNGKFKEVEWIRTSKIDTSLKEEEILNTDDVNKLIQNSPNVYFQALIAFLFESGCRIGEAKKLNYGDFKQTTDGFIVNIPSKKTKSGYRKIILPMSSQYIANLKLISCAKDEDKVFGYMPCYEREKLHEIGVKAAIGKPVTPHKFRHGRCTEDAKCGYTEQILKKKFGWSAGSKMVDRYTHMTDKDVMNADLTRIGTKPQETKQSEMIEQVKPISIDQAANRLFALEDENSELKNTIQDQQAHIYQNEQDLEAMKNEIEEMKKFQIQFFKDIKEKYSK